MPRPQARQHCICRKMVRLLYADKPNYTDLCRHRRPKAIP